MFYIKLQLHIFSSLLTGNLTVVQMLLQFLSGLTIQNETCDVKGTVSVPR